MNPPWVRHPRTHASNCVTGVSGVRPAFYGIYVTAMTPKNALDPQVMTATTTHAQPSLSALLLGSGVSTGAGVPTGWGVVRELVRRVAAAANPENDEAPQQVYDDPESWLADHGDG